MPDPGARSPVASPGAPAPPAGGDGADVAPEDRAALAEEVDLDADTRRRILILHAGLGRRDHYELLGVERDVDAKALKRVYYQLAATYHPDRYFRKKLGTFKARMEAVFGRLTLAYETLADGARRSEYDAYLEEQARSRGIERLLEEALAEAERAEELVEREIRAEAPASPPSHVSSTPPGPAMPPPAVQPSAAAAPPSAAPSPNVGMNARRDALARRLLGGRGPSSSSNPPARPSVAPAPLPSVADAMEALRRRYEARSHFAKAARARKYISTGEAALASGDAVAAANAFQVALRLSPADPALELAAREAQTKADEILGEAYARQAEYEEKNGQWPEAARSWQRVCKVRPKDAESHERAASALLKAEGDLHEAGRVAAQACALDPSNPRHRVTLASVYLAAGLPKNARRELETAAQLAPHDGTIQALMKKVGR